MGGGGGREQFCSTALHAKKKNNFIQAIRWQYCTQQIKKDRDYTVMTSL